MNNGLNGEGPFSPERAGTVPVGQLVEMCFSGEYYRDEMIKTCRTRWTCKLIGTNDAIKVEQMVEKVILKQLLFIKQWHIKLQRDWRS